MLFGVEKLEWRGYPTVKKFWWYVYSFWYDPQTWQTHRRTDRQTPHDDIGRACIALRDKNCDFQQTKYLILTWEGHSYYGMPIGTSMQHTEWCHFQWPWITANQDFKVTFIWCWISRKGYVIGNSCNWIRTFDDLHMPYSVVTFQITSSDLVTGSITWPLCSSWASCSWSQKWHLVKITASPTKQVRNKKPSNRQFTTLKVIILLMEVINFFISFSILLSVETAVMRSHSFIHWPVC